MRKPASWVVVVLVVVVVAPALGGPTSVGVVVEGPSTLPPGDVTVHPCGTVTGMGLGVTRGMGLYVITVSLTVSVEASVNGW
jgi:hypothetical protein